MTDRIIPYFNFYATDFKALKDKLTPNDLWDIVNAMCDICLYSETEFKPNNKFQETYYNKILDNFEPCKKRYLSCVENGGKGGRPPKDKNPQVIPQVIPSVNPQGNQDKTRQNNIIQDKIKEDIYENEFNEFWEYYTPIKCSDGSFIAKGSGKSCRQKLIKLLEKGENYEKIIAGLKQYLEYCKRNNVKSCGAEVFINQRRWENDYSCGQTIQSDCRAGKERQEPVSYLEIAARAKERFANKGQDDIL